MKMGEIRGLVQPDGSIGFVLATPDGPREVILHAAHDGSVHIDDARSGAAVAKDAIEIKINAPVVDGMTALATSMQDLRRASGRLI